MNLLKTLTLSCCALALSLPLADAVSAAASKKTWPCVQRKRLELSAGTMWTGPESSETDRSWQDSKEIADLVKRLSKRRVSVEDAQKEIDEVAAKMTGDKKTQLTKLFNGLFQTLNSERRNIVNGIEKYSGKQLSLSNKIKETAIELDKIGIKEELTDEDEKRLEELNKILVWDTRIYDERTKSLEYVCESPVLLEQRLYALAKKIQENLE